MNARLVALSFSPWSEKARWALDHHSVSYREIEHVPLFGEPLLRLRARTLRGRVTVPLLVDGGEVFMDSWNIARYAERVGKGTPLFVDDPHQSIETWNKRSDMVLSSGRALLLRRVIRKPEALQEALPPFMPQRLRPRLRFASKLGAVYLSFKYETQALDPATHRARIERGLVALRAALQGPDGYLLGSFSYADIAMAVALQVIEPVSDQYLRIGPHTRLCWTDPDFAEDFSDLLAWRDRIYAKHR